MLSFEQYVARRDLAENVTPQILRVKPDELASILRDTMRSFGVYSDPQAIRTGEGGVMSGSQNPFFELIFKYDKGQPVLHARSAVRLNPGTGEPETNNTWGATQETITLPPEMRPDELKNYVQKVMQKVMARPNERNDAKPSYTPPPPEQQKTFTPNQGWRNPDDLHNRQSIAFVYLKDGNDNNKIFYGKPGQMHREFNDKFMSYAHQYGYKTYLKGRVGKYGGENHVSFWDQEQPKYDQLFAACLQQLQQDNLIDNNTLVSTPLIGTVPLPQALGAKTKTLSPEEEENVRLAQQMHTMTGQAKRDAMNKLGVGGGGKPHPMQTAMQKQGLLGPGQKWWARTSETARYRR